MEIENLQERIQQLHTIKLLYEDFFKTVVNFLCNDPEILILEYMIDKSKEGELEFFEDKLPQIFRFEKNMISAAIIKFAKSKLIEIKERATAIDNNPQNNTNQGFQQKNIHAGSNLKFERKKEKFYRLNRKIVEEYPVLLERFKKIIEKDLSYEHICPRCNRNYKTDDVWETNRNLIPGKFRCLDTACSSYLHELTEAETKASNATMGKVLEVVQIIQSKFDLIKDKEWPFKKSLLEQNLSNNQNEDRGGADNAINENFVKLEEKESNKESWAFKSFKGYFIDKYGNDFDYLPFVVRNKLIRSGEVMRKMEEGKKRIPKGGKNVISHRIILENRKRCRGLNDAEFDKLYKNFKK